MEANEENYIYCGFGENEEEYEEDNEYSALKIKNANKNKLQLIKTKKSNEIEQSTSISSHHTKINSQTFQKPDKIMQRIEERNSNNHEELADSNKYFNSLQHFQSDKNDTHNNLNDTIESLTFKSSKSNYSFEKSSLFKNDNSYSEHLNSANNGANLFVLLAANRKKSSINEMSCKTSDSFEKLNVKPCVKTHSASNFLSPQRKLELNLDLIII